MNALNVLLLCIAAACAVPVHFPTEKTVIYNYHADVKAGIIEPAQYASQFAVTGQLHIKKDISDPTLNNAYYVKLQDVKYGMHNGMSAYHESIQVVHELNEVTQQIQDPFLIVYDEMGKLQGIKVPDAESGWSRNMKQAIASILQLDLSHIQLHSPMKPHSFVTVENTIHGTCHVNYDVRSKNPANPEATNVFVVTKLHDLKNCSHFVQRTFDHMECEKCHVETVDDMTTVARRVFHVEQQANQVLIKHLVAHSNINYFPYNARSEAHYLFTNTTLDLNKVVSVKETRLPVVNFQNVPLIRNVTFNKPLGNYALHAAEDLTHGRHIVELNALIPRLKKMLLEAADYLDENHLEAKEPEWKHGQTINKLQHTMSYMDLGSLEQVYNVIQNAKTPKEVTINNIFLQMISIVGTTATCHFTRNVIRNHKVTDGTAISMLTKLPMYVKVPSERLLLEMEELLKLDDSSSPQVKKASILCFSTLIHKTFIHQHQQGEVINPLLERYLHRFLEHVKNNQEYDMRVVYLMAMKNVRVGNIEKLLEPIIRGEISISEHPQHMRVQAIWAIKKAVADKVDYTHNLLWPIFADVTQPLSIRIITYDMLMSQLPNMKRLMDIYWLMVHEQNNHLYNYHLTTLKGLANSVDPCLTPVREMARKIIRYTKIRPVSHHLSSKQLIDYTDPVYEHGESLDTALILDELTGMPHAGYIEHHASNGRKPVNKLGFYWSAYGLDEIMKIVKEQSFGSTVESLTNKNVRNILNRAAHDMPTKKLIHVDLCITLYGQVILANHYDRNTFNNMIDDLSHLQQIIVGSKGNYQEIIYDTLYEMQVPTDMGLQGVLNTRMPHMMSLKYNNVRIEVKKPSVNLKLEVDARIWRHGEYAMSIYNPIADVWHSIRRATAQDVALPLTMNIGYNHEAKSLKVTMPRLPVTKLSHSGLRYYAKNLVSITGDEQDLLKNSCTKCQHHAVVTTGEKRNQHIAVDSKDLGLKYSTSIFDCENNVTPVTIAHDWYRVFSSEHKNTWGSKLVQFIMAIRQKMANDFISPQAGSCGTLIKAEPSIVYPTSHIDLNIRANVENIDHIYGTMHALTSNKINIRGTFDTKAASTNESARLWDMNMNIDMSQGHVVNNMKIQIMRVTPGEKNLKICLDAQKSYPLIKTDPLKLGTSKEETNTKMIISAGFTDDDKCVRDDKYERDDMLIVMSVKGEKTEDQKKQITYDSVHSACKKDIQNPQFHTKQGHVPKTMDCIHETIRHTTMKKYTINLSYKKVPVHIYSQVAMLEDYIRTNYLPHIKYITDRVESGNAKITIEYPTDLKHVDATIVTPVSGYKYVQIPLHEQLYEGMIVGKPVPQPEWHTILDNVRFSIPTLRKFTMGLTKTCTIYSQILITLDNGMMSFVVPDEWTLMSGDHIDQTYAIFIKSVQGNKIAVKMYVAGHELEMIPNDFNTVVTIDGNIVEQHEKGVIVPEDEPHSYAFRLSHTNEHLVVLSQRVPVSMANTPNSVTVILDTALQGRVTGVCGHMDNTHKEKIPKIYTVAHL